MLMIFVSRIVFRSFSGKTYDKYIFINNWIFSTYQLSDIQNESNQIILGNAYYYFFSNHNPHLIPFAFSDTVRRFNRFNMLFSCLSSFLKTTKTTFFSNSSPSVSNIKETSVRLHSTYDIFLTSRWALSRIYQVLKWAENCAQPTFSADWFSCHLQRASTF